MPIRHGGNLRDQRYELITRDLGLDQYRLAGFIHTMESKHILGKIDFDGDHGHGLPLLLALMKARLSIMAL